MKRGNKEIEDGQFDAFHVFILCPRKYHDKDEEAQKYDLFVSYEECEIYFKKDNNATSMIWAQQINAAIEKAKNPPKTTIDEASNRYFRKYYTYQQENYPDLDLRTKPTANGYWPEYGTGLGKVYIIHKMSEGYVDLTFPKAAEHVEKMDGLIRWLRQHGFPKISLFKTGASAALRLYVPKLDMKVEFDESEEVELCFEAIGELTSLARFAENMSILKNKIDEVACDQYT